MTHLCALLLLLACSGTDAVSFMQDRQPPAEIETTALHLHDVRHGRAHLRTNLINRFQSLLYDTRMQVFNQARREIVACLRDTLARGCIRSQAALRRWEDTTDIPSPPLDGWCPLQPTIDVPTVDEEGRDRLWAGITCSECYNPVITLPAFPPAMRAWERWPEVRCVWCTHCGYALAVPGLHQPAPELIENDIGITVIPRDRQVVHVLRLHPAYTAPNQIVDHYHQLAAGALLTESTDIHVWESGSSSPRHSSAANDGSSASSSVSSGSIRTQDGVRVRSMLPEV